mgnify:FL=1|tara:strand:+ start:10433 stop:10867 length:435 start_codon:yes stop_codon:yes gene_type:complete
MPSRGTPIRKSDKADSKAKAPAKKTETKSAKGTGKKTIKATPLSKKVKRFLDNAYPKWEEHVFEQAEKVVNDGGEKYNVMFMRFSDSKDDKELNDDKNVEIIKDILFSYHTVDEKTASGQLTMCDITKGQQSGASTLSIYFMNA